MIKLQVIQNSDKHVLKIETHLRIWQTSPDRFVPKINEDGGDMFEHQVRLRNRPLPITSEKMVETKMDKRKNEESVTIKERTTNNDGSIEDSSEANKTSKLPRDLVFNFWALSPSQRRKIMQK